MEVHLGAVSVAPGSWHWKDSFHFGMAGAGVGRERWLSAVYFQSGDLLLESAVMGREVDRFGKLGWGWNNWMDVAWEDWAWE